ncbi:Hypothetical protein AJAP_42865 (plasmid) [Amycolatopsis japonica]|uniref:Uncharacterized protein n=1 Tax=Amycolatopsis japonica TaxID=208439 RepID=A0A075VEL0_9PSEU|nr:hypothetical protein [Amycolatopsis japonica]AIG81340.1 Hypothetical protein AJAP_42865 [Amycolatopsis japonica]
MAQEDRTIDDALPELWTMQGLATAAGVPRSDVAKQYLAGLLPGVRVGERLTVFRAKTLNKLRKNPAPNTPKKDGRIPELVTTAWVAERWDRSSTAIDRLYRSGKIPGKVLGGVLLFRRALIEELDIDELTPGPHHEQVGTGEPVEDPKLAGLLTREEAAAVLGINPQEVITWYRYGRVPGTTATTTATAQRKLLVFREATLLNLDESKLLEPARDAVLPDLVSGAEAAEILGISAKALADWNEAGKLPGRLVTDKDEERRRMVYRREVVERLAGR